MFRFALVALTARAFAFGRKCCRNSSEAAAPREERKGGQSSSAYCGEEQKRKWVAVSARRQTKKPLKKTSAKRVKIAQRRSAPIWRMM